MTLNAARPVPPVRARWHEAHRQPGSGHPRTPPLPWIRTCILPPAEHLSSGNYDGDVLEWHYVPFTAPAPGGGRRAY